MGTDVVVVVEVVVVAGSVVVVVPGATVVVVDELVEEEVDGGIVVVLVVADVVLGIDVDDAGVDVAVEVVVVEAETVVVVVGGAAGMIVAAMVDEPVTDTRRTWITPAMMSDGEPVTTREAFGASIPEFARTSFAEPSIVMSALLPGTNLMAGVAGVLPLSVSCDEPVTTSRPPVSLLHARVSFAAVPHASTSDESVPVTLDELVTLRFPASQ